MKNLLLILLVLSVTGCSSMFPNRTLRFYESAYPEAYRAKNATTLGLIKGNRDEYVVGASIDLLEAPSIWEVLTTKEGAGAALLSDALISGAWVGASYWADKEYGILGGALAGEDNKKDEPQAPTTLINALDGGKITIRNTTESFGSGGITARGEGSEILIEHPAPE